MVTFGQAGLALMAGSVVDGGQLQSRVQDREAVSSGFRQLDPLLPGGGIRRGSLIEWLAVGEGNAGVHGGLSPGRGDGGIITGQRRSGPHDHRGRSPGLVSSAGPAAVAGQAWQPGG
jgi:hypothetical protein